MSASSTGDEIDYVVTYLAMDARPGRPCPPLPAGPPCALIAAKSPPNWYFLDLYRAVGHDYEWTDQFDRPAEELADWLHDENVVLYTFLRAGWPHGFFVLDRRTPKVCELAYFGLVPEAMGRGLGWFLLDTAVHMAWETSEVRRVTVNTNSLDHPRALPLYQKAGFVPFRRETHRRTLTRDRPLLDV